MTSGRPTHPLHRALFAMSGAAGPFGQSVRRKPLRRLGPRSLASFTAALARLGPGDLCLDLGANMGSFTEKLAATGAEVHAYEPDPHCFSALQTRFAGRANVHLHPQAVSGEAGSFTLRRTLDFAEAPDLRSQSSSIAISTPALYDDTNSVQVDTLAFDEVIRSFQRPVALVKIDIEGAEFLILDKILADQAQGRTLPIGALFVETHERHFPDRVAMVKDLRILNWDGKLPYPIDTFWP